MTDPMNTAAGLGLRFFGRMSAAISHDLKNTLSIMNESAGLVEDMAMLAETGRPLDVQRIKQLGAAIKRQIQRTDGIVRNMNRFAHSVDDPIKEISLTPSLEMLLAIGRRLTDARGVTVVVLPNNPEVSIVTRPFYFHHLVWWLIESCMDYAGPPKRIDVAIKSMPPFVHLVFKGLKSLGPGAVEAFASKKPLGVLALLAARTEINGDKEELSAILPQRIDA